MLLAVTLTAAGFAFDAGSGNRELSSVFSACYALGCLLAVLAVRQANIFTAVIQPPLLLFVTVPGAYFLFHSAEIHGLKDLAINCGYPLIERFPVMFFTSAAVLLVGIVRWYLGMSSRRGAPTEADEAPKKTTKAASTAAGAGGLFATLSSKVSGLVGGRTAPDEDENDADDPPPPRRPRSSDRPRRTTKSDTQRSSEGRSAARKASSRAGGPSRSRRPRPAETEIIEAVVDRPRRSRPSERSADGPEPRRRPRSQTPREGREPRERRSTRERETRGSREREGREPREPREPRQGRDVRRLPPIDRRDGYERPRRRPLDDYEPLEPHGSNGSVTHHPVSRVRYRSAEDDEYRSRPRARRSADPDAWEYDV